MSGQMDNIIKARIRQNITQDQIAKAMGISRQTYINIENGKKELSVSQAKTIASILRIGIDDIICAADEKAKYFDNEKASKKYKQIILNSIQYGADSSDGKITKTKLAKLVYLADYIWFFYNEAPMSGMTYRKYDQGPVPDAYFRIIDELELEEAVSCEIKGAAHMYSLVGSIAPTNELSSKEISLIKAICEAWKNKSTKEIVDFTHEQLPWQICRKGEIIPYDLITQEEPEKVYGNIKLRSIFQ